MGETNLFGGAIAADAWGFGSMGDGMDAAKMEPFTPAATGQSAAWWERTIQYGLTKAIDNRYGPQNVAGNVDSGSFAGQNGRTYTATPRAQRGAPTTAGQGMAAGIPGGWLTIGAAALLAYVAFKG